MKNTFLLLFLCLCLSSFGQVSLQIGTNQNNFTVSGALTAGSISSPSITSIYQWGSTNTPYPFGAKSNTVVILDGQSLMVGMAPVLTNMPWWTETNKSGGWGGVYTPAVGATSLTDATNRWWGSNNVTYSSLLKNGTNGLYLFWGMQGDINSDPANEISSLTNWIVTQLVASNFNVVLFTVEPIGQDLHQQTFFTPIVNNFIRAWHVPYRTVDTAGMFPNQYDFRLYISNSFDHLYPVGYTNAAVETSYQLLSPWRHMPNQEWANLVNTNYIITTPGAAGVYGYGGYLKQGWFSFSGGGFEVSTNYSPPTAATVGGSCLFWNSNATIYLLTSTPNSLSWAATNKLGGP